jgi:hypothetical protein
MGYYTSYCRERSWIVKKEGIAPPTIIKNYDLQKNEYTYIFHCHKNL